ncbi:uncharacterized protein LOC120448292 [Drosophila santomea]|uniref:uncharacterized protein LOC120448292 n=1 Tax=Drosophila santomea TaxID=129105 RepID=UPI0019548B76|nr:uncharacterized protein LOC120448292 [Drosophila santomea]
MVWIWSLITLGIIFGAMGGVIISPRQLNGSSTTTTTTAKSEYSPSSESTTTSTTAKSESSPSSVSTTTSATGKVTSPVDLKTNETTLEPLAALDKSITADLENILTKYERECMGNSEFTENLDLIRKAVKWNKDQLEAKINAKINFNTYNGQRISLEKQIDQRIEALNNILPTQEPNSRCSKFYLKQRETLKNAKTLSNEGKSSALLQSKEICKTNDYNYDDYYY